MLSPVPHRARPIPLARFREHVLTLYRPPLRSKHTCRAARRTLDLLAEMGGVETTADLTTTTIARFVAWRQGEIRESPNTTRGYLGRISALCSIAMAEGWLRLSPFLVRKRWIRATTPKAPRVHSRAEIARVLETARDEAAQAHGPDRFRARRLRALAALVAYTGLRRTEALTVRVEDFDVAGGVLDLKARVGGLLKTDAAAQAIPIPDALAVALAPWLLSLAGRAGPDGDGTGWAFPNATRNTPWTGGPKGRRPGDEIKALGRRAGVEGLTFQSLRHSWATHAEFWGLPDTVIQRVLRHTNLRTQQRYRHAERNNLRALVRGIDFGAADAKGDAGAARP